MCYYCEKVVDMEDVDMEDVDMEDVDMEVCYCCEHGMEGECVKCLENYSDLWLYQRLSEREREFVVNKPYISDFNRLENRYRYDYMYALNMEMEHQGRRNLPNIYENHALRVWAHQPGLFSLKDKLDLINKIWFRTDCC